MRTDVSIHPSSFRAALVLIRLDLLRSICFIPDASSDPQLYAVHVEAVNDELRFVPIVVDQDGRSAPEVAERLLALVQGDSEPSTGHVDWERQRELRDWQSDLITQQRTELQRVAEERNAALMEVRLATVRRSFQAKIAKRHEWLQGITDERVRRMRDAEIRNLERQLEERLEELEAKRQVIVTYELVAEGVLELAGVPGIQAREPAGSAHDPATPTPAVGESSALSPFEGRSS